MIETKEEMNNEVEKDVNITYCADFIRKVDNEVEAAKVLVLEKEGVWKALWFNGEGCIRPEIWYEGERWEMMLSTFRYRLSEKFGLGYVPHFFERKLVS